MRGAAGAASILVVLSLATAGTGVAQVPLGHGNPLDRRISVHFDRDNLGTALSRLRTIFGLPLAYSPEALPVNRSVSLDADNLTVRDVLDRMLGGTGLTLVTTSGGTIVIAPSVETTSDRGYLPEIATGVRQLDQIVVMGTPVAGAPEREQPNAVSVVNGDDLVAQRYSRTADLIRTALPGVVLWDPGAGGPPGEIAAVRGASSFTARGIKTYVDGVEVASPTLFTMIDPRSIERIEVIRGPQGAALYGSDAINGVIQIVTRKGHIGETGGLRGWASAAAGPFDRDALGSTLVRQNYAASAEWGGNWSSLEVAGSMDRLGSQQTAPSTRGWSVDGGGRMVLGSLLLSGFGRAGQFDFLEDRSFAYSAGAQTASTYPAAVDAATVGLTAVHQTTDRWTQTLVVGYDRAQGALGSSETPLASLREPLGATHETASRSSIRFSSALDLDVGRMGTLTTTLGIEHSQLDRERGAWDSESEQGWTALYDDAVRNTGTFLQGKLRSGPLTLNAGLRTEWNSAFGPAYGAALASSVGASYTAAAGANTVRVRAGWGRGIRPPEPGMSRGMASAFIRQEANPGLAPEVQAGVEAGVDFFAERGSFVRLTLFDQRASDLIQSVLFPAVLGSPQSYQYQNVGAIQNRGVELETGLRLGAFGADALLYYTRSRVAQLAPTYSGFLRPGDELPEVPALAGSARISYTGHRFRVALGTSLVGSWLGYDWVALAAASQSQSATRPAVEDYLIRYPSIIKPYLSGSVILLRQVTGFLTIDNLTNSLRYERNNGTPPAGRSALIGLEFRP
jgi:iron complex outermembrane recepter protein